MPKLIRSEVLESEVEELFEGRDEVPYKEVEKLIRKQPATGLTKVTRCKNCMEYIITTGKCRRWGVHISDDNNFCVYGLKLRSKND